MTLAAKTLRGPKIRGKHTTVTPAATRVLLALKAEPSVVSIALGEIRRCGSRIERVKAAPIHGGVCLKVYGSAAVQKLRVVTADAARALRIAEGAL